MNQYKKQGMTKDWLLSNGFRYSRVLSTDDAPVYTYRFPVYKYKSMTVLESEISVILGEDGVKLNVYDYGTNDKYAPFYYCEYGNFDKMLKEIYSKINKELSKLNINFIEQKGNHNGSKNKEIKRKCNYPYKRK